MQPSAVNASKKINAINASLMDGALVVKFIPESTESNGAKVEAGKIIAFLYGFFGTDNELGEFDISRYSAIWVDADGFELGWVISSIQAASYIADDKPIEWIKNSIFEFNDSESRLHKAKTMISRLEKALRKLLSTILACNFGDRWWEHVVDDRISNAMSMQQKEELTTSADLLDYTYLSDLRIILLNHWQQFETYFNDKDELSAKLIKINKIRRMEAHNRCISGADLEQLTELYHDLMGNIAVVEPGIIPVYLSERWRVGIKEIIDRISSEMRDVNEPDRQNLPLMFDIITQHKNLYDNAVQLLSGLYAPPECIEYHKRIKRSISHCSQYLNEALRHYKNGNLVNIELSFRKYRVELNKLKVSVNDIVEKFSDR